MPVAIYAEGILLFRLFVWMLNYHFFFFFELFNVKTLNFIYRNCSRISLFVGPGGWHGMGKNHKINWQRSQILRYDGMHWQAVLFELKQSSLSKSAIARQTIESAREFGPFV